MISADKFCLDNFQNIKKALVVQDIFNILPILDRLFYSEFLHLFVLALQLL